MSTHLTYAEAGVDIHAADKFVETISKLTQATHTAGVVPHRSEYASLFKPDLTGMSNPLIAATCDGVGTKLMIARDMKKFVDLGQDLVGMNVNDLLPAAARPLFFLDYLATGKLDHEQSVQLVQGMARACSEASCALLGGETAEMPGVYQPGDFDLAGFAVGLVDASQVPDLKSVKAGDQIVALPATGVHSNGFSLARKALFERGGLDVKSHIEALGMSLGDCLLTPTPIYVRQVFDLMARLRIKSAAHITGGGLLGRAERLLQPGQRMVINPASYPALPIFDLIAKAGNVKPVDMARTFNMSLGYLAVIEATHVQQALQSPGWLHVGEIVDGPTGVDLGDIAS